MNILVKDVMWKDPEVVLPTMTIVEAARKMAESDAGILVVGTRDQVLGMVTDRDLVVRGIARGRDCCAERIDRCMTAQHVITCYEDDTLETAIEMMRANRTTRLGVLDRCGQLTGIFSIGHILRRDANVKEITQMVASAMHRRLAAPEDRVNIHD